MLRECACGWSFSAFSRTLWEAPKRSWSCRRERLRGISGRHFRRKLPGLARFQKSVAVAVNHEYSEPEALLHEGDEVALLPPVSGGAVRAGHRRKPR